MAKNLLQDRPTETVIPISRSTSRAKRASISAYGEPGERFDPELHEAVAQQPLEGRQPGEIAEVYQAGYRNGDGVIRAARVLVAG